MVTARETAQSYIDNNPVMVFSKSYCPHCRRTKELLKAKQEQFAFRWEVIELDLMGEEGKAIQDALVEKGQERTVPRIYIMKEPIGGNSDIQKMGPELDEMLQQAAEASAKPARGTDSPKSASSN